MARSSMSGGAGGGGGQPPAMIGGRRGGFFRAISRAAAAGAGTAAGSGSASRAFGSNSSSSSSPSSPTRSSLTASTIDKSRLLTLSLDPTASFCGAPVIPFFPSYPPLYDDDDFELVSGDESSEDGASYVFPEDSILSSVPSLDEVQNAVAALNQVSPVGSEIDWMEPSLQLYDSRVLHLSGSSDRVYDAFHLLQTDPCVQRMVISLSSDKEVWNAVLRNEVVQELRQAFHAAEANGIPSSGQNSNHSNPAADFVRWIFNGTKARVCDVIEKIANLVNQLFPPSENEKKADGTGASPFDRLVDSAYMLCVVVMLIVVIGRTVKYQAS